MPLAMHTDKLVFLCEGPRLMPVLCVSVTCVPLQNMLPQSAVTNHADCSAHSKGTCLNQSLVICLFGFFQMWVFVCFFLSFFCTARSYLLDILLGNGS